MESGQSTVCLIQRTDLRPIFAANLRRLRNEKGLSQAGLARRADVNRSYLNKLESGRIHPGLEVIGNLATALEAEPAEFLRLPRSKH